MRRRSGKLKLRRPAPPERLSMRGRMRAIAAMAGALSLLYTAYAADMMQSLIGSSDARQMLESGASICPPGDVSRHAVSQDGRFRFGLKNGCVHMWFGPDGRLRSGWAGVLLVEGSDGMGEYSQRISVPDTMHTDMSYEEDLALESAGVMCNIRTSIRDGLIQRALSTCPPVVIPSAPSVYGEAGGW